MYTFKDNPLTLKISTNKTSLERVWLISSQTRKQTSAEQLLALNRGHWGIENKLHCVRDGAYDDHCRAREVNTPRTLAGLFGSIVEWVGGADYGTSINALRADSRIRHIVMGLTGDSTKPRDL